MSNTSARHPWPGIFIVLAWLGSSVGYAQSFVELDRPVVSRYEATVVQYRGDVYAFNGFGPGIKVENSVEKYDVATRQWRVIATTSIMLGTAVTHNGIVRHGKDVWLIGGRRGDHPGKVSDLVWIFDLDTYQWRQGPTLPVPVAAGGAALVNDRIHWFGGLDAEARCDSDRHFFYDLKEPTAGWQDITAVAAMPRARNHFATIVNNGLIYAMGGQHGHDGCRTPTEDDVPLVHVFDPQNSQWQRLADLPAGQSHSEPGSFVHQGYVYMVGGKFLGDRVYQYDPDSDEWQIVLTLPEKLLAPISRIIDGQLLVVSSGGGDEPVPTARLYELELPAKAIEPQVTELPEKENSGDRVLLAGEVEHYDQASDDSLSHWKLQPLAGASNGDAMIASETAHAVQEGSESYVRFTYFLYFDKPGEYALWVRGWRDGQDRHALSGVHESAQGIRGAIDPSPVSQSIRVAEFSEGWTWSRSVSDDEPAVLNVPTEGIHALHLWFDDKTIAVDKFVLSNDLTYQPIGKGPDEFDGTNDSSPVVTPNVQVDENVPTDTAANDDVVRRSGGSISILLCLLILLSHISRHALVYTSTARIKYVRQ